MAAGVVETWMIRIYPVAATVAVVVATAALSVAVVVVAVAAGRHFSLLGHRLQRHFERSIQ